MGYGAASPPIRNWRAVAKHATFQVYVYIYTIEGETQGHQAPYIEQHVHGISPNQ
jgi:hypothetical protein